MLKVLLSIIMLFIITACGGSSGNGNTNTPNVPNPPSTESSKVACVGDSITLGYGLNDPAESYPSQLNTMLGADFTVGNFGAYGATALKESNDPYWGTQEYINSQSFAPDIVVIMFGTNDLMNHNWSYEDKFISDYSDLINIYKNLESRPTVYICYPPPIFGEISGITDAHIRNQLLPMIDQIATINGVQIIDNYNSLIGDERHFEKDDIHPNAEGARIMAETVYQAIY